MVVLGDDAIGSLGRFAILVDLEGGGTFQVAGDGKVDQGGGEFGVADGDGVVGFVGLAVLELAAEVFLGVRIFGEDDDTGGVAVKTVNQQSVIFQGRLGTIFTFGHREEAGGFVEDEDVVVFVEDGGTLGRGGAGWQGEGECGAFSDFGVGLSDDLAVHGDEAGFDEGLEAGAVIFGMLLDQKMVEADFGGGSVGCC